MEQATAVQPIRYKVRLNPEQREAVMKYLTRTSLLWNLLLQVLKDVVDTYLEGPNTDEVEAEFSKNANAIFNSLMADPEKVPPNWVNFMASITALDHEILYERFSDLLDSYILAKSKPGNNETNLPRRKADSSSHSVRFAPDKYKLKDGKIIVTEPFPFEIPVPETIQALHHLENTPCYLSITKNRTADASPVFGPMDESMVYYVLTFRPVEQPH